MCGRGTDLRVAGLIAMARYHLHLFNDIDIIDEEGRDFPDLPAAEVEAVRSARDVIADHILSGRPVCLHHRMEIADAGGTVLKVIAFQDVVRFEP